MPPMEGFDVAIGDRLLLPVIIACFRWPRAAEERTLLSPFTQKSWPAF